MVTVAIPVLDGRRWLPGVFTALRSQSVDHVVETLVLDSGSSDGSREIAHDAGARVIELGSGAFDHASARNRLMHEARGEFVAFLTQDAEPASPDWLAELLKPLAVADDVALVYGPYLPRHDCPPLEASRLTRWFQALSPDGRPRTDRLTATERETATPGAIGPERGYFTDANGCVRRAAWEQIPYPRVPYAEDHALAFSMMRAGWAKVFAPAAGVLHSHDYTATQRLRRAFDESRGLREIYDRREPLDAGHLVNQLRGAAGVAVGGARARGDSPARVAASALAAAGEQTIQLTGAALGSRADRVPAALRGRLSLERRPGFTPWSPTPGPAHILPAPAQRWT